jgi:hypothetical protein
VRFLGLLQTMEDGYQPGPETRDLAVSLDLPRAFVDALFTSARARGLVKPMYGRGSKIRWATSKSGVSLIERLTPGLDQPVP